MRPKKRYVLLRTYSRQLPPDSKYLFQNSNGFIVKTTPKGAEILRKDAVLISGSIWKLKKKPKLLNRSKSEVSVGMK